MSGRQIILALLLERGPMTAHSVSKITGLGECTARYHMNGLHRSRCVHIADWIKEPCKRAVMVWAAGSAPDAPKPAKGVRTLNKYEPAEHVTLTAEQLSRMEDDFHQREDKARRERLLAQIVIRRDPMIFMTAGRPT